MCSHYQTVKSNAQFERHFGIAPPVDGQAYDIWPGQAGHFIWRHRPAFGPAGSLKVSSGVFGLLPHWAKDRSLGRRTYNARLETATEKPSFRDAWAHAQHCIIPADAVFEPDWRSGRAVVARITQASGEPLGIAGLWSRWQSDVGEVLSFTMLTVNADAHPLMRAFHKPGDEKRMVVVLPREQYADWLQAPAAHSLELIRACPAPNLIARIPSFADDSRATGAQAPPQSSLF